TCQYVPTLVHIGRKGSPGSSPTVTGCGFSICRRPPRLYPGRHAVLPGVRAMSSGRIDTVLRQLRHYLAAERAGGAADADLLRRSPAAHDEGAFAALVQRYGPLVLGVCRRVLSHEQDAEDAFQATFLILVRKAGALHKGGSLASWLYTVAYHAALKARAAAA